MATPDAVDEARALMLEADEHLAAYRRKRDRARELIARQHQDRRARRWAATDAAVCECGHRRHQHGSSYSINYTGGFCHCCDCRHFLDA